MPELFANPLAELKDYTEFREELLKGKQPVGMTGCIDSEKVHLMSTFLGTKSYQLVVTYSEQRAREIYEDYRLFTQDVRLLPPRDLIFFQADLQNHTIASARMRAMLPLILEEPAVIITTIDGLMNGLVPLERLKQSVFVWKEGQELDLKEIPHRLILFGYERVGRVENAGEFSVRGGILDLFPLTEETPFRVEFWGDEIDSIRSFDPMTQRSIENRKELTVFPATELVLTDDERLAGCRAILDSLKRRTAVFREAKEGQKAQRLRDSVQTLTDELQEEQTLTAPEGFLPFFYW